MDAENLVQYANVQNIHYHRVEKDLKLYLQYRNTSRMLLQTRTSINHGDHELNII